MHWASSQQISMKKLPVAGEETLEANTVVLNPYSVYKVGNRKNSYYTGY